MSSDFKKATRLADQKEIEIANVLKIARPTLGPDIGLGLYRLLRLVALEDMLGRGASGVAYLAGKKLGLNLGFESLGQWDEFFETIKVGIIKISDHTDTGMHVDVYECGTCVGMDPVGRPLCHFEGGLIAGMAQSVTGQNAKAVEVSCIGGLGHETCGYDITLVTGTPG